MKKIFLSTMMFASMQLLSASENNYQNFQTTRTDFDDQGYQAQRKFNNNNNNNDYEDVVEDTRLLTDDYINEMDLNKNISISSLNYIDENKFAKKYKDKTVKTPNGTRDAYDYFVKEYEYKIDEFMSMVFLYDTKDNEMVIKFCHPGENCDVISFDSYSFDEGTVMSLYPYYGEDFLYTIANYITQYQLQEVEIKQCVPGKDQFEGKMTFKTMSQILKSKKRKEDDIDTHNIEITSNSTLSFNLYLLSVEDARSFIDFFFQYAMTSEENVENNYHFKEEYAGTPGNHCKNLFLQCETIKDHYQVGDDALVDFDYENNVGVFSFPSEDNKFMLDKELFEKAKKELGGNYSHINIDEEDDDDVLTMLIKGTIDMFALDISSGSFTVNPIDEGDFYTSDNSKQFIRVLVRTLELMEQKYFDSKKLEDTTKSENSENSNNN